MFTHIAGFGGLMGQHDLRSRVPGRALVEVTDVCAGGVNARAHPKVSDLGDDPVRARRLHL